MLSLCKACVLGFKTMEGLLIRSTFIDNEFRDDFIALASKFEDWNLQFCVREDGGVQFTTLLQGRRNIGFLHVLYGALVELGGILGYRKWNLFRGPNSSWTRANPDPKGLFNSELQAVARCHGQCGKMQQVFDVVNQSQQQWESCVVRQDVLKIGDVLSRPCVEEGSQMYELLGHARLMIMVAKVCVEAAYRNVDSNRVVCLSGGLEIGRPGGRLETLMSRTRGRQWQRRGRLRRQRIPPKRRTSKR